MVPMFGITANAATAKTVMGAIGLTSAVKSSGEIKLLSNIKLSKALTIEKGKNVTIDLNGYVLEGSGTDSVIKNKGTLIIKDSSNESKSHYFKVNSDGLWVLTSKLNKADYTYDATNGLQKNGEAADDIPAAGAIIKVAGGVITGGAAQLGGGIDNQGNLILNSGSIVGNMAKLVFKEGDTEPKDDYLYAHGGGVYNDKDCSLEMTGGAILGNVACVNAYNPSEIETAIISYGGGIDSSEGNLTVSGGTIGCNIARVPSDCYEGDSQGGGIYLTTNSGNTATIKNAVILNNTACYGGGIMNKAQWDEEAVVINNTGSLTMDNVHITGNDCIEGGGGVYNYGGTLTLTGSLIQGNNSGYYGGGVENNEGNLFIKESTIEGNTAKGYGGGIYNVEGNMKVDNTIIKENKAYYGGGVFTMTAGEGRCAEITNSIITKNNADNYGGGIYNDADYIYTDGDYYDYIIRSNLKIINCQISENKSGDSGGGIAIDDSDLEISGTTIENNTAVSYGGGICLFGEVRYIANPSEEPGAVLVLKDSSVTGNTITNRYYTWKEDFCGAGIFFYKGKITLAGKVVVTDNTSNSINDNLFLDYKEELEAYRTNTPISIGEGGLTTGSKIGITRMTEPTADAPVQITDTITNPDYFFSDDAKYHIQKNADNTYLELAVGAAESAPKTFLGKLISGLLSIEGFEWIKELSSKAFKLFKEFLILKTA